MAENFNVFGFELDSQDMDAIKTLDTGESITGQAFVSAYSASNLASRDGWSRLHLKSSRLAFARC